MAELLSVPLKKSSDVDIVKPLKNLLQATYGASVADNDIDEALTELNRLRQAAIWKVFDKSSLEVIYSYYDQLAALENKIPPQEVQIPFKWKDAFDKGSIFGGRMSLTVSSLSFEKVCVLFNVGALQSMQAAQQPLDTEDSLKLAAKLLQQAAGVFAHLKGAVLSAVHGEPTPDLGADALAALSALMLAQAQEVIAYKCIRDEMKEGMVAKVCAQCDELYADAARALQKDHLKPLWDRNYLPTVQAKQAAFRGLSQYYQSQVCKANKQVGEQISRLQVCVEQLKTATSRLPSATFLGEQLPKAQRELAAAQKENDFIYHDRILDAASLEPIQRAAIAKPLTPPDRWQQGGKDIFAWLSPMGVQVALQASTSRVQEAVGAEVNKLRDATQLLNSIMASLNLPACIELADSASGSSGLPDSILSKARAVRDAGGLPALEKLMQELPELLRRNTDILDETERMLREEEEADTSLRSKYGARWSRTESKKLTEAFRANAAKYRQIIDNAVRADSIVQQKFNMHKESIDLLSRSEGELVAGVPAADPSTAPTAAGAAPTRRLRQLCEQVETIKAERDVIESELKGVKIDLRDQFESALANGGHIDEPALSIPAIGAALRPLQQQVADTLKRQEELVQQIQESHAALMSTRGGGGGADSREARLGALCAAHDAYNELTANLTEGTKFYNDLTQLLVAFQNKVSDFCFARRTEKEELLKDLTQDAARSSQPPPQDPSVPRREAPAPPNPATAPATAPGPALPYPVQPQGMPVPYGVPAASYQYYAAPPMPAVYNPYATLPYPHHQPRLPAQPPYQPYQYPPPPQGYPYPPQQ